MLELWIMFDTKYPIIFELSISNIHFVDLSSPVLLKLYGKIMGICKTWLLIRVFVSSHEINYSWFSLTNQALAFLFSS